MKSMTGYGSARAAEAGITVEVEIKSWNHKGLDLQIRLPESLAESEPRFRQELAAVAVRGKVVVNIRARGETTRELRFNQKLLAATIAAFEEATGARPSLTLSDVLAIPNAIETVEAAEDMARLVFPAFSEAVAAWDKSRIVEGEKLLGVIVEQFDLLETVVVSIERRNVSAAAELKARLEARIGELLSDAAVGVLDENRLELEVAILAEKSDVKEEIVRLRAHLAAARKLISESGRAIGAELGFILQECLRETNTVGSKTQDLETIRAVILGKTAVDRIKELAANVI